MNRKKLLCIVMSLLISVCSIPLTTVQAQEDLETLPEQGTPNTDEMETIREITPQAGRVRAANYIGEEYEYRELQDGTVKITSYCGNDTELVIPANINGKRVSNIGEYAFQDCSDLTAIELSDGITGIGDFAFSNCNNLTSIKFPASLTSIGNNTFEGCRSLTRIALPDSVANIGMEAFFDCRSLIGIDLPAGLTNIGDFAFSYCSSLTEITVDNNNPVYTSLDGILYDKKKEKLICCPGGITGSITILESVINIEQRAFWGCSSLTAITIPGGVASIATYAFLDCGSLAGISIDINNPNYISQDGILYDKKKEKLIRCPQGKTGNITIPETVTSIENSAFDGCSSLTGITVDNNNPIYSSQDGLLYDKVKKTLICCPGGKTGNIIVPKTVTSIENGAFGGCSSLTGIELPAGLKSIGDSAFSRCSSLTGITIDNNNQIYSSQDGLLYDKKKEKLIRCPQGITGNITIPETVTRIENSAFYECSGLTGIELPAGLTSIGDFAFSFCDSMTEITLPAGLTNIGHSAFLACSSLTEIEFPAGLTSIGDFAFSSCDSLTEIALPAGLNNIGNSAFRYCSGLIVIEFPADLTSIEESTFWGCRSLTEIELPTGLKSIGHSAFRFCSGLTEVALPIVLTSIGDAAFSGCKNLTLFVTQGSYAETYAKDYGIKYGYINSYNVWEGYKYRKLKDGTVEITYYQGNGEDDTELVIPSEINGRSVTSIKDHAFSKNSLIKVTLPDSITSIGVYAFSGCWSLTEIVVDSNNPAYTSQDGILYDKKKAKLIFCPRKKTGDIIISENITSIGDSAFRGCRDLMKITLPDSLTNIGDSAFWGCLNLTEVEMSASLISIGDFAFQHCNNLNNIEFPASLTSIGESAFWNCCLNLTKIELPAGLTSIGDSAFRNCLGLTGVELPAGLTSIGDSAFSGCTKLTEITVDSNNQTYTSEDGILYDKKKERLICCPKGKTGTAIIPESVTSIDENAFDDWGKLTFLISKNSYKGLKDGTFEFAGYQGDDTKFVVPAKICGRRVTHIGSDAFQNCSSLTEIKLPNSISIGNGAFSGCSSLTEINLPNSITSIGDRIFSGCSSLTEINLPDSITSIGNGAFGGCSSLTEINLPDSITSIGERAFYRCANLIRIKLPAGLTSIGDYVFSDCDGLTGIELPAGLTSIGNYAFSDCDGLTGIELPAGLTSIGDYVFSDCDGLREISLPDSIISMGAWAFYKCKNLTKIKLPAGLTNIEKYAFSDCDSLTEIELPAGLTSIGDYVFSDCDSLTGIELPAGLTSIGNYAFSICSNLTEIELPAGLTSIGGSVFFGCEDLTRIELPASLTSIEFRAFRECKNLMEINIDSNNLTYASQDGLLYDKKKENLICCPEGKTGTVTIPESVVNIDSWAFYDCSLTGIELPAGLTSIGENAFYKCANLTSIKLPAGLTSIGNRAFYDCSNLTEIELPAGLTSIGVYALSNCSRLMKITVDNNNPAYTSQDGLLYDKKKETLICCPGGKIGTVTIPESVTSIEDNTFLGCSSLTGITVDSNNSTYASQDGLIYDKKKEKLICCPEGKTGTVIIPESVTSIGDNAFSSCSRLTGIELPAGLASIGDRAFWNCLNLTRIELPAGLTSIGNAVFTKCNLTEIELPAGLSSISFQTFSGCSSLTKITVDSNNITYASQDGLLYDKKKEKLIYCPEGKTGTVTIPESVTSINSLALIHVNFMLLVAKGSYVETYAKNHSLKYGYIEDCNIWEGYTYRKLEDNTVELINYDTNDTKFAVPSEIDGKHVTGIGSYTFSFCNNLTTITVSESVTSIAKDAFGGCNSLTEITVDSNNLTYTSQDGILYDKKKETLICCPEGKTGTITIPENVTVIEENAFSGCKDLTLLVAKGSYAEEYAKNHNLKINYINDSSTWEGFAFKELKNGTVELTGYEGKETELAIPVEIDNKRVARIGSAAFSGCSGLTAIIIPESVTSIEENAFLGCNSLTEITVDRNNSTYTSQDGVLYDKKKETLICCPEGKTGNITIPESVTSIEENAFLGCKDLTLLVVKGSYAEEYAKNHNLTNNYIDECAHDWETTIVKATAEKNGSITKTCTKCGEQSTEIIYAAENIKLSETSCPYNGKIQEPSVIVKDSKGNTLKHSTDYTVTYPKNMINVGSYTVTIQLKGNYSGTVKKIFQIIPCSHTWDTVTDKATTKKNGSITKTCTKCGEQTTEIIYAAKSVKLSKTSYPYNGKAKKPTVTIKNSRGKALKNNTDYMVTYPKNRKNVGIYTITIKLKGKYRGTVKKTFRILPKGTTISKITPKKKGFTLKWKKQAVQTTGYEIAYSTNKNFTKKTTKTAVIGKNKTVTKSVSKQKPRKKYFVKIRTYKTVKVTGKSKKLYSVWSKVMTVTTKR